MVDIPVLRSVRTLEIYDLLLQHHEFSAQGIAVAYKRLQILAFRRTPGVRPPHIVKAPVLGGILPGLAELFPQSQQPSIGEVIIVKPLNFHPGQYGI